MREAGDVRAHKQKARELVSLVVDASQNVRQQSEGTRFIGRRLSSPALERMHD